MNYREQFKLVPDELKNTCIGCCFSNNKNNDSCNLLDEVGGWKNIEVFDNQVGSCVSDGGVYKRVPDSGQDMLTNDFLKSSYN